MSESEVGVLRADIRRLESKIDDLTKAYERSSAKHSQRLTHVEEDVKLAHNRISGVKKWVIGGLITIASMAVRYAWALIESASNR